MNLLLFFLLCLTSSSLSRRLSNQNTEFSDDDNESSEDFNIRELVDAWKEYIKDRGGSRGKDSRTSIPKGESNDETYDYDYEYEEKEKEESFECQPKEDSYRVYDEHQCDKFSECNIKGELKEMLCPDGLVFDIKSERCDYPSKVNCTGRPELQPAQVSVNCSRANGFFPFSAAESCQKFFDCRGGKAYLQTCPEGVIFDSKIDSCITPDQSSREECSAGKFLGFDCPVYSLEEELRFGNHDRLSHPTNCVQFFSCLRDGRPRLGACPRKTVFDPKTGHCGEPANVPGCEDHWKSKGDDEYDEYYD